MRSLPRRLSALLLVALMGAACTDGDSADQPARAAQGSQPQEATPAGQEPSAEPSEEGSAEPRPSAAPTEAIATAVGELPGLRLEILGLRRSGDAVTLDFAVVNETADDLAYSSAVFFASPQGDGVDYYTVSGVTLTDDLNSQRYLVLREADSRRCVCSIDVDTGLPAGTRAVYYANFPAPPDDVTELSVQVPNFSSVEAVPVG